MSIALAFGLGFLAGAIQMRRLASRLIRELAK